MMVELSRVLDAYGLDVWIWYPAMDHDYTDPATVASALHEWGDVFRQLPRVDAVFVPGGDPGHTAPGPLMDAARQKKLRFCIAIIRAPKCGFRRKASTRHGSMNSSPSCATSSPPG